MTKMCILHTIIASLHFFVIVDAKLAPTVRLNNGYHMPVVGLGTSWILGNEGEEAIKLAIDVGYRHIDTAWFYGNEVAVGNAIRAKIAEGVIKREDVFVTTKLWNIFHEPEWVEKAFNKSLENLNLDYIDLFLLHWPEAYQRILKNSTAPPDDVDSYEPLPKDENGNILLADIDYLDTWHAMEKLISSDRLRSIGLSNFNAQQIQRIISLGAVRPVTNQFECHPRKNARRLIAFCILNGITFTAHTPLGHPTSPDDSNSPISNSKVLALAKKYDKSPAQIILRYSYQNGAAVIPKSTKKERLQENIDIFDFRLSIDDMEIMDSLNEAR